MLVSKQCTYEHTLDDLTLKTKHKIHFYFHFEFFQKFISFTYEVGLTNCLHLSFLIRKLHPCEAQKFWRPKVDLAIVELFAIQLWEFNSHPYEGRVKSFLWELILGEKYFHRESF